ncbi:arylamine N-acetyltransferase 2-like [Genypterus blacodes]|uniref:arylamine N-acetyltransferase 2-like n=1 Tax=Genypterus blacodes TaxID=154954 RepID=UPI003F761AEE
MDVEKYLMRIGFVSSVEPSLDVLRSLHTGHLLSVPFENLTAHSGGEVKLDLDLLYEKIVIRRRGGFCCENNGLFAWLLAQLGFQVTLLSGQVRNAETGHYGPPFDHLIILVTLDGQRWLCDVGFGSDGFSVPLSLDTSGPQEQGHRAFRIRPDGDTCVMELQSEGEEHGDWTEVYKFTLEPRRLEQFTQMCQYHQSSPSSLFFCKSLCTIMKPGGRISYVGHRLTTTTFPTEETRGVFKTSRELQDQEIPGVLAENFGIILNSTLIPKDDEITPPPILY